MGLLESWGLRKTQVPSAVAKAVVKPSTGFHLRGNASLGVQYRNRFELNYALWVGYRSSPWVYKAISSIAGAISKGYKLVAEDSSEELVSVPELQSFLNNPNDHDNFTEFVAKVVTQICVFGVCYIEVQRLGLSADQATSLIAKSLTKSGYDLSAFTDIIPEDFLDQEDLVSGAQVNGIPTGMQVLPAQQMTVKLDRNSQIQRFEQLDDNGVQRLFAPNEVIVILHPASMDLWYGDSPLEPISTSIVTDQLVRDRQKMKLKNATAIGDIYTLPTDASDTAVDRFHEQLNTQYRGTGNAGNFLVVNSPVTIEHVDNATDGDFLKLREVHCAEISSCLGVPLSVMGVAEGNGLNGQGAMQEYRAFLENTCRPLARHIQADLNKLIVEPFEALGVKNCRLELVLEDTQDNADLEAMWGEMLLNGSMTVNEVRQKRGQPPIEGGDLAFIAAKGVQVVRDLGIAPMTMSPTAPGAPPQVNVPASEDSATNSSATKPPAKASAPAATDAETKKALIEGATELMRALRKVL